MTVGAVANLAEKASMPFEGMHLHLLLLCDSFVGINCTLENRDKILAKVFLVPVVSIELKISDFLQFALDLGIMQTLVCDTAIIHFVRVYVIGGHHVYIHQVHP